MRERGEVSPRDVRRHARSVFAALAHCHAHGVVHRDVKGGTFSCERRATKRTRTATASPSRCSSTLASRGVSRRWTRNPRTGTARPGTKPPSSHVGHVRVRSATPRYQKVDVFAMGCTLFFLCVGKELYGATGEEGEGLGARTKTKARAHATQAAMEEAMDDGGLFSAEPNLRDREAGLEEEMVVRRRRDDRADDAATPPDARETRSPSARRPRRSTRCSPPRSAEKRRWRRLRRNSPRRTSTC